MTIRKASISDLEAILAIYAELDDGQHLDLHDAERIFKRMQQYPNYTIYIAELEGEIVGAFELLIMDNLAHMGTPSGVVEDVVIRSRSQGRGIGKAMMRFAIEQCRKAGCYKLVLSSNLKRASAHRFYETLGFQQHGYSFVVDLSKE
ncbi:MAG: GNAT family N-acetyltransferase [Chloroflexales bacterium]|nr:GNAT family N-acetyltransferase [Chloroflexales bacterium]